MSSTDSRTLQPGDLFVALRGPRFDGHAFVADVLARGAAGAIVERGRVQEDARTIEVPDTLEALQRLAHAVRSAVANAGHRDHGERRQDDDEGGHRGTPGHTVCGW